MKSVTLNGTIMRTLWHASPDAARAPTTAATDGTWAATNGADGGTAGDARGCVGTVSNRRPLGCKPSALPLSYRRAGAHTTGPRTRPGKPSPGVRQAPQGRHD